MGWESVVYLGYMRPSSVTCGEEGQGEGEGQREREEEGGWRESESH